MSVRDSVRQALEELQANGQTDAALLTNLYQRLDDPRPLTRDEGAPDHFCSIVIPFAPATREVFVGHHIKSQLWIPPGGHIDTGETPLQAAVREIREELHISVTPHDLALFSATSAQIMGRPHCTRHMDFWYVWEVKNTAAFEYDPREFHEAHWRPIEWAIDACANTAYTHVLETLAKRIS